MENPKYVISKDAGGRYRFILRAKNGEPILRASEGYSTNSGCRTGIASCQVHSPYDHYYDKKVAINGQYYFNLKARNGEIIGVSETYTTSYARDNGIEACKRDGSTKNIEDLS